MYDYEINNILCSYHYNIPVNEYLNICSSSPQIDHIKFEPFGNKFFIWTKDGNEFSFMVHYD